MPFDNDHEALLFDLRMALMAFRIGPPDERRDSIRRLQAGHIVAHLERSGWTITRADTDTDIKPSNIGE